MPLPFIDDYGANLSTLSRQPTTHGHARASFSGVGALGPRPGHATAVAPPADLVGRCRRLFRERLIKLFAETECVDATRASDKAQGEAFSTRDRSLSSASRLQPQLNIIRFNDSRNIHLHVLPDLDSRPSMFHSLSVLP